MLEKNGLGNIERYRIELLTVERILCRKLGPDAEVVSGYIWQVRHRNHKSMNLADCFLHTQ